MNTSENTKMPETARQEKSWFSQRPYRCRLDWGRRGTKAAAKRGDLLVVVRSPDNLIAPNGQRLRECPVGKGNLIRGRPENEHSSRRLRGLRSSIAEYGRHWTCPPGWTTRRGMDRNG